MSKIQKLAIYLLTKRFGYEAWMLSGSDEQTLLEIIIDALHEEDLECMQHDTSWAENDPNRDEIFKIIGEVDHG